jgi:hypothetical protein
MIHIRVYREGVDTWNQPIIKKEKKEREKGKIRIKKEREKEKEKTHVQ